MKRTLFLAVSVLSLASCTGNVTDDGTVSGSDEPTTVTTTNASSNIPVVETRIPLFGDLHIHTKNSFDAYIFGTRSTPDDAYRFGKGEAIDNGLGQQIQLSGPPLDFMAVTDHGEYMGIVAAMGTEGSALSETAIAKRAFGDDPDASRNAFVEIGTSFVMGNPITDIHDKDYMKTIWDQEVEAANSHYVPGEFTTFAAYEFTAMDMNPATQRAGNLHRNVVFKDDAPTAPFSTLDSINPEDLWDWMDAQREEGRDVLAIPHNSNGSDGAMFALTNTAGDTITQAYAEQRLRNEPIVEITQVKGTSETHPLLAPNDEWADHELYDSLIGIPMRSKVVPGSFVRNALSAGLGMDLETNPYEFGVIGSSDTHVSGGSFSEEEFFGKFAPDIVPARRGSVPMPPATDWSDQSGMQGLLLQAPQYGASGLAGVWATSNTREAIFDAMRRRETFATSGPRITVRFFMGDFTNDDLAATDQLDRAYAKGVPMGSKTAELKPMMIMAAADAQSEPLERVQVVALRADGSEAIYDVACAGGIAVNAETHRCELPEGEVDLSTCESRGTGTGALSTIWSDPDARDGEAAAYYVRVLERPKCRWSTWDAIRNGTPPNPELKTTLQDRAWSSAIWIDGNIPSE